MGNSSDLKIREMQSTDLDQLRHLYKDVRQRTFDWMPEDSFHLHDFDKDTEGEWILVAEINNQIIGFAAVWVQDAFLHHLFLRPTHQRQGVGRKLLDACFAGQLRQPARLKCVIRNTPACRFYEKQGWLIESESLTGPMGSYRVYRYDKKIPLRQITSNDHVIFPEALELLNRTQGRDLCKPDFFTKRMADPNAYVVGAFNSTGQLIGVATAQVIDEFDYYVPFDASLPDELKNKTVGSLATMSVREDYQGQGIGKMMSAARLDWLKSRDCKVVLGVSWLSGLAHTSDRVFEKLGFKAVARLDDFYKASSLAEPFDCPGCQKAPCACAAVLYRLDL